MAYRLVERYARAVLFASATATDVRGAVVEAVASGANLHGADLRGTNLQGADLRGAYLRGADLRGAYLRGADLRGAYLRGTNLGGAYLRGTNLGGVNLRGANLGGANLDEADLSGADLRGARGILPDDVTPLQILGSRDPLIVREPGKITIGCLHKPVAYWADFERIGAARRYTTEQIAEYGAHIEHAKRWMALMGVLEVREESAALLTTPVTPCPDLDNSGVKGRVG